MKGVESERPLGADQRDKTRETSQKECDARNEGEAYPSIGMENMQRAYVLSLKQGGRIFLFEDRALGTPLETPMVSSAGSIATTTREVISS